jgi:hypothetical protein
MEYSVCNLGVYLTYSTLPTLPYLLYLTYSTLPTLPYLLYLTYSTLPSWVGFVNHVTCDGA